MRTAAVCHEPVGVDSEHGVFALSIDALAIVDRGAVMYNWSAVRGFVNWFADADRRERASQNGEQALTAILKTVSDALIFVDDDGTIIAASRAAQDLMGYDGSAIIDRSIAPLVEGGWFERLAAIAEGGPHDMRIICANGDRLPIELRMRAAPDDELSGHILFFTDSPARKPLEAQRILFETIARNVAIAEFAAHMTHELNQPLAAASNFLVVAQHLSLKSDKIVGVDRMIELALNQILRVGAIIRSTHQKATSGDIDLRSISVHAAIEEAVTLLHVVGGDIALPIMIDVHPATLTAFVDPVGIQQVMANLLRNAIEAFGHEPHGEARITVTARRTGDQLIVSVGDNGPGIPPSRMADLFEPFGQRDKKGGMGLGLSICRTIVELHGGKLTAENLPGGGASFTFTLPLDGRDEPYEKNAIV